MSLEQIISFAALGVGLLILREVQLRTMERAREALPRVQGRVTACDIRAPRGLRFCYETSITYAFELDGEACTARDVVLTPPVGDALERALDWSVSFPAGARVAVVPDRSHPERSRLERDAPRTGWRRALPVKPSST